MLDEAGVRSATVCGVSYGGLIAFRYAAARPARVDRLVLVSSLAPSFVADDRLRFYTRAPRLLAPIFVFSALQRARREIRTALPRMSDRLRFTVTHGARVLAAPLSPRRMVQRIGLLADVMSANRKLLESTAHPSWISVLVDGIDGDGHPCSIIVQGITH